MRLCVPRSAFQSRAGKFSEKGEHGVGTRPVQAGDRKPYSGSANRISRTPFLISPSPLQTRESRPAGRAARLQKRAARVPLSSPVSAAGRPGWHFRLPSFWPGFPSEVPGSQNSAIPARLAGRDPRTPFPRPFFSLRRAIRAQKPIRGNPLSSTASPSRPCCPSQLQSSHYLIFPLLHPFPLS